MSSEVNVVSETRTHHCCSIIPHFLLSRIADHPNAPEAARTHALNSLGRSRTLARNRTAFIQQLRATGGGPGGAPSIIPAYILSSIAHSNQVDSNTRNAAQRTLDTSQGIRVQREQLAANLRTAQGRAAALKRFNRLVYDSQNSEITDCRLVRSEGDALSADVAVDECYDGFGATFNFFANIFDRNSINDGGMSITGSVHYDQNLINAFWNGSQMLFGDGDGVYFNRFTASVDVIGHELTHGVTQYTANLVYQGEPGALNESISDVFGSMVKQYQLNQTADAADWLIGAELFTSRVQGVALHSMKAPGTAFDDPVLGKDPQMASYDEVLANPYPNDYDNGGVHIYSGVPNRAFYLAAVALGRYSWDRAGKVWYATLTDQKLSRTAKFKDFAELTCKNAEALFGESVKAVVAQAWSDVGLDVNGNNKNKKSVFEGTWTGSRSDHSIECNFTVSGTSLEGGGSVGSQFRVINGSADNGGAIRFTADFMNPDSSSEEYIGSLSGNTISGVWENSDRKELRGNFRLSRKD